MATTFTGAKSAAFSAGIDIPTAISMNQLEMLLVMSNFDMNAERLVGTLAAITTLDEFNGAGYAREVLSGVTFAVDGFDMKLACNPMTFGALSNGTRKIHGGILHLTDGSDIVLAFFPAVVDFDPGGAPVTLTPGANGLGRVV